MIVHCGYSGYTISGVPGAMQAQIHLLSAFSVSEAWQSPAQFNIIAALIFIVPFLFQCLSNDYLALAFTSGISSYTLRWLSEWLSCGYIQEE